jgi:hypothetical protein
MLRMKSAHAKDIANDHATPRRRGPGRPFQPGNTANPLGPRGRVQLEEQQRQCEVAAIVADLAHEPSAVERLLIDELAALAVRARRLRRKGQPTDDVARLMTRIASKLGIRQGTKARRKDPRTDPQRDLKQPASLKGVE